MTFSFADIVDTGLKITVAGEELTLFLPRVRDWSRIEAILREKAIVAYQRASMKLKLDGMEPNPIAEARTLASLATQPLQGRELLSRIFTDPDCLLEFLYCSINGKPEQRTDGREVKNRDQIEELVPKALASEEFRGLIKTLVAKQVGKVPDETAGAENPTTDSSPNPTSPPESPA